MYKLERSGCIMEVTLQSFLPRLKMRYVLLKKKIQGIVLTQYQMKVKEALDKERDDAEPTGHYHDLQTTFSKDPCVQKIHFTTDLV